MGHADDNFFDSSFGAGFEKGVEDGDEGFGSFEGEAFLADVAGVEKAFEGFGGDYFFEDAALLGGGEGGLVMVSFHPIAEPAANGEVHDVHEFDADVVAVGLFEEGENLSKGAWTAAAEGAGIKNGIEIGLGKAEGGEGQVGVGFWGEAEGVEVGEGVAEGAVGEEEIVDAGLGEDVTEFW